MAKTTQPNVIEIGTIFPTVSVTAPTGVKISIIAIIRGDWEVPIVNFAAALKVLTTFADKLTLRVSTTRVRAKITRDFVTERIAKAGAVFPMVSVFGLAGDFIVILVS